MGVYYQTYRFVWQDVTFYLQENWRGWHIAECHYLKRPIPSCIDDISSAIITFGQGYAGMSLPEFLYRTLGVPIDRSWTNLGN